MLSKTLKSLKSEKTKYLLVAVLIIAIVIVIVLKRRELFQNNDLISMNNSDWLKIVTGPAGPSGQAGPKGEAGADGSLVDFSLAKNDAGNLQFCMVEGEDNKMCIKQKNIEYIYQIMEK